MNTIKKENESYDKLAFISQSLIPLIDDLKETTQPKRQLKKTINDYLSELEKITKTHYSTFSDFGLIKQEDGNDIESIDIYNVTAKAYDRILNLKPSHLTSLVSLLDKLESDGVDLNEILIDYKPLEK